VLCLKPSLKVWLNKTGEGLSYKTAKKAPEAWAQNVYWSFADRHAKKIGMAAYHDAAWQDRNGADSQYNEHHGIFVFNYGPTKMEQKAPRRSYPIFLKLLGR
jgi:hypothetical protein